MGSPFQTTTLGYPRLGEARAYKRLLEAFWAGKSNSFDVLADLVKLKKQQLQTQERFGIDLICCGDFSTYDHVLDMAVALGAIPERFGVRGEPDMEQYFQLARGADGVAPLEMTKWFNTNYHYLVPELPDEFCLMRNPINDAIRLGNSAVETETKPWVLGPFTFLRLAKLQGSALISRLPELTSIYRQMLDSVNTSGLIQVDEPALVTDVSAEEWRAIERCYAELTESGLPLCVQTYFGDVAGIWSYLVDLPVDAIGVDIVDGKERNLEAISSEPFPKEKKLVAGIVNGRNIWRSDLQEKLQVIEQLADRIDPGNILLSPSCSLLHLPETVTLETDLPEELRAGLCFAQERLQELVLLAEAARDGFDYKSKGIRKAQEDRDVWLNWTGRHSSAVQKRLSQLREKDFSRELLVTRRALQEQRLQLPNLPTTTIGSFPQTTGLRVARANRAKDPEAYQQTIRAEVERVIRLQEEIGLDVLVDGEPDRSDMVEFFAEKLPGFATLRAGWVQSYGSRCVRPPVIYGDVERDKPLTLEVSGFAQSLTSKPVKGMLTGPVTILCWSFVRDDVPLMQVAYQVALAIRDETVALEQEVGLAIIQIDEPAFREGLPLKGVDQPEYLDWAAKAFRLASSGVRPDTQIHTHMCYAEFAEILEAIAALDADVISIEDARSHGEMLGVLSEQYYPSDVGPGVWDIHSPQVPSVEFIVLKLRETLTHLPQERIWVNPDCGLKTRGYQEVIQSLKNMVEATKRVREEIQ